MKYLMSLALLFSIHNASNAQRNAGLKGEWIQVRAETNYGSIYYIDSATKYIMTPESWMVLNFENRDTVCVSEKNTFTSTSFFRTPLIRQHNSPHFSVKRFYSNKYFDCEVLQHTDSMLVLAISGQGNFDKTAKIYLIPKPAFDTSTPKEKATITGPWERDYPVYDSLLALTKGKIFTATEQVPEYPFFGDQPFQRNQIIASIKDSLSKRGINYPDDIKVTAVVEQTGRLSHIAITGDDNKELLHNVTQILGNMMRWKPARQNGVTVRFLLQFDMKSNATH